MMDTVKTHSVKDNKFYVSVMIMRNVMIITNKKSMKYMKNHS